MRPLAFNRMSTTPTIADYIVMKLPKEGPLSAAPAAVDAASVIVPPAASETTVFGTTGDSSPVIFWPVTFWPSEPPHSIYGGEPPIAPAALVGAAGFALNHFRRNRSISLFFCHSNREAGSVSALGSGREHQEGCLSNTPAFGLWWPRLNSANFLNPQENQPTFHLQED